MARISTYTTDTTLSPEDKWIGTDGAVGSENGKTKNFTVQDMADYVSDYIGEEGFVVKGVQVTLTQADILNSSGFSKLIVPSKTGKIIIPTFVSLYRKPGGIPYPIGINSLRLFSVVGSTVSSISPAISNISFQTSNEGTSYLSINSGETSSQMIRPGNNIYIALGNALSPSVITGGTGDLVLYLTYTEITV
jgi:hypothetical protein